MTSPIKRGRFRKLIILKALPHAKGVYRFVDKSTRKIVYIGITSNLYARFSNHKSKGKFDASLYDFEYQVSKSDADWSEMQAWEKRKIFKHHPTLNRTKGGNGRTPRK